MRLPSSRGLSIASSQHAKIDPARSCPCPGSPRGTCPGAAPGPGLRQCRPALDSVAPGPGRGRPRLSQEPALGPRLGDFRRDRLSFGGEASSRLRTPDGARPDKQWTGLCRHGGHDQERHAAAGVLEPHHLWRSNAEIPPIPRDALIVCRASAVGEDRCRRDPCRAQLPVVECLGIDLLDSGDHRPRNGARHRRLRDGNRPACVIERAGP
jgi:hypothetical protein